MRIGSPYRYTHIPYAYKTNTRLGHNKRIKKVWVRTQAPEKITQVFIASLVGELSREWINPDKSWESSCSPVHREYKSLCFISIHKKIPKLQTFVYVAVTKEFTDQSFFSEFAFLLEQRSMPGKTIPWYMHKLMANTMSQDSIPYVVVSVSYNGLCKRL